MSSEPAGPARRPVDTREVRLLEGPNLYFPRPAVKVTLALPGYLAAPVDDVACGLPRPLGLRARPARRARLRAAPAGARPRRRAGRPGPSRPRPARGGSACAPGRQPRPTSSSARSSGGTAAAPRRSGAAIGPMLVDLLAGGRWRMPWRERAAAVAAAPPRATAPGWSRPRIPVASVTGTNGKTTTTRLLAHICMTAGPHDRVELHRRRRRPGRDGRARRLLRARPARAPCSTPPACRSASSRRPAAGCCCEGMGVTPQRRLASSPTSPPTTSACRASTPSTSSPRSRPSSPGSPGPQGWVVLNGEDPRVWAMRAGIRARPWVFTPRPERPGRARGAQRRWPGDRPCSTATSPCSAPDGDARPARPRRRPADDAVRAVAPQRRSTPWPGAAAALGLGIDRDGRRRGAAHLPPRRRASTRAG